MPHTQPESLPMSSPHGVTYRRRSHEWTTRLRAVPGAVAARAVAASAARLRPHPGGNNTRLYQCLLIVNKAAKLVFSRFKRRVYREIKAVLRNRIVDHQRSGTVRSRIFGWISSRGDPGALVVNRQPQVRG